MREAKKQRLRDAWHGPLTLGQIARNASLGERWLQRFWSAERDAGRLPAGPRPHFVDRSAKPAAIDADIDLDDDTPIGDFNRSCEAECAASLAALRKHHPDLDRRAAHLAPASWLAWDHRLHAGAPLVPAHRELMAMCREADNAAIARRHLAAARVPA